ncbi:hypothetical protein ANN_03024 [Periplaneta americana]|uniref:Uncharacterized protein n=1 Tax=Periplaneta americana TaxID=6978 RepID=A0ABQ8TY16_PERAM|nr:hypothetical protein ANN_03024 [Periplaneta americana]
MADLSEGGNETPGSLKGISDVERSFSAYKVILSDTRRSFSFETLKMKVVVLHCSRNRNQANNIKKTIELHFRENPQQQQQQTCCLRLAN